MMDNGSIHSEVIYLIEAVGAKLIYTTPYSLGSYIKSVTPEIMQALSISIAKFCYVITFLCKNSPSNKRRVYMEYMRAILMCLAIVSFSIVVDKLYLHTMRYNYF